MNPYRKNNGFTLIEVLVALVILSIALTAIVKATGQNIRNTHYLQNKNIAAWIATETLNEARAGVIELTDANAEYEQEKNVLGQAWKIKAYSKSTPNPHIQELHVEVYRQADDTRLAALMSYRYAA